MNPVSRSFVADLEDPQALGALFDTIPGIYFYAKNLHSQFMLANRAELELLGASALEEIVGKSDADFFEKETADLYMGEDQVVFTGQSILNKRWMVPDHEGRMQWYLSTKIPLRGKQGEIIGLCGLLRDLRSSSGEVQSYGRLAPVIEHINAHYRDSVITETLAALVGLSVSQFNRKFREFTGLSPAAYILTVRINAAKAQLLHTERTVADIAEYLGFYDQSHFTRLFSKAVGQSPSQFRRRQTPRTLVD
jgi:AraC-like DNA-binding protein